MKLYQVLLTKAGVDSFIYKSEFVLNIGDIVEVPFRSEVQLGVIWSINPNNNIPEEKIKSINSKVEGVSLQKNLVRFLKWMSEYLIAPPSNILRLAFNRDLVKSVKKVKTAFISEFPKGHIKLSDKQELIYTKLLDSLKQGFSVSLLEGVTGSGKTEIFLKIAMYVLENKLGQVLIMVPEISLLGQLISRIKKYFSIEVAVWHSAVGKADKRGIWNNVRTGREKLILGTRSALFLPFENLKLIIVDEEHDISYKQEDIVVYNARDMAVARAKSESISIILASATPSLETYKNAVSGKYKYCLIKERYREVEMPDIRLIDMRLHESEVRNLSWVSPTLRDQIIHYVKDQKQALLFINRKGFAPLYLCRCCGYRFCCKNCSTWLTYHKGKNFLKCHHCNYTREADNFCPECQKRELAFCGPGVERVEEEVRSFIPNAKILVITKENLSDNDSVENSFKKFGKGEADIMIGTQMITKGHHFPKLKIVGVIDADLGMMGGDLRASERCFQLITQVSGRAGRESEKGIVYLQTYYPESPLMQSIKQYSQEDFLKSELSSRELMHMPPFYNMASITFSAVSETRLSQFLREFMSVMPEAKCIEVFGPAEAIIYKLRGRYRKIIFIKSPKNIKLQNYIKLWLKRIKIPANIRSKVDIQI